MKAFKLCLCKILWEFSPLENSRVNSNFPNSTHTLRNWFFMEIFLWLFLHLNYHLLIKTHAIKLKARKNIPCVSFTWKAYVSLFSYSIAPYPYKKDDDESIISRNIIASIINIVCVVLYNKPRWSEQNQASR